MILAQIEWQGGSFAPIDAALKNSWLEGRMVRSLILNADGAASMVDHADKRARAGNVLPLLTLVTLPGSSYPPVGYRHPVHSYPLGIFIAAAAGNGQILFSDVPVEHGARFAQFR